MLTRVRPSEAQLYLEVQASAFSYVVGERGRGRHNRAPQLHHISLSIYYHDDLYSRYIECFCCFALIASFTIFSITLAVFSRSSK